MGGRPRARKSPGSFKLSSTPTERVEKRGDRLDAVPPLVTRLLLPHPDSGLPSIPGGSSLVAWDLPRESPRPCARRQVAGHWSNAWRSSEKVSSTSRDRRIGYPGTS